ncbi:MAG: UTP--glucose-1-phosphate uridylyltransferase GalU [Ectothiorhodospiraceae bacterium]|nr:UTP--glucose-1-phosphate uridylyltransferase GalU [Ectothiorhodospiraceae bacterium]
MTKTVRKAVFPVAGLGTRFLPATKANAKEMLPVVDKPLIQYAVEEAVEAGITEIIFVTGRSKRSIEDHFDRSVELEAELEGRGKTDLLAEVRSMLPPEVSYLYTRQAEPLGLGHAVLCARPAVGNEPFAVLLPDDLIDNDDRPGCIAQLCEAYARDPASYLAVQNVPADQTDRYGIVSVDDAGARVSRVGGIVEKPKPAAAPSTLAVVGRYLLTPDIFAALERTPRGAGGEIQLTDAIATQVPGGGVRAMRFEGVRYDCGSKLGFLQATVELGVKHHEVGADFRAWLATRG